MKKDAKTKWNRDKVLVEFFNAVKERRSNLSKDTKALFSKNEASFLEELRRQASWREYSGRISLSQHDYDMGIYYNVVNRAVDKKKDDVARELLAPAVRALMTEEDPEGRDYLTHVDDHGLLCQLLFLCARLEFNDAVYAFAGAVLLKHWDDLDEVFDDNDWRIIALAATVVDHYVLAALAFKTAARLDREPERRSSTYFDASRAILEYLKHEPQNIPECEFMAEIAEACAKNLDDNSQFRVLLGLTHAWLAKIRKDDTVKINDELVELVARAVRERDADIPKDDTLALELDPAVKVPLEWQTLLANVSGNLAKQINAFPEPVFSNQDGKSEFPVFNYINGVWVWDFWEGLLPRMNKKFSSFMTELLRGTEKTKVRSPSMFELQTNLTFISDYTLLQSQNREECDISVLGIVSGIDENGKNKQQREIAFPFPSKDCPENASNTTGRIWEYFVWRRGFAADARIELESGRHVYATLPFFAGDVHALVRGFPMTLYIAAFASKLRKTGTDAGHGKLVQGNSNSDYIKSASEITAKVESVSEAFLWNGTSVAKFMLRVESLGVSLPVFIHPKMIEGSKPKTGDSVECSALFMADFRDNVISYEDFRKENPGGCLVKPVPEHNEDSDVRNEQKETFLLECHVAGTSHVDDVIGKTAEIAKDSVLLLRREPGNAYDHDAIAIYTAEENRIGYVPQKHNPVLAKLLDGGKKLIGKVTQKEIEENWVKMRIGVYLSEAR